MSIRISKTVFGQSFDFASAIDTGAGPTIDRDILFDRTVTIDRVIDIDVDADLSGLDPASGSVSIATETGPGFASASVSASISGSGSIGGSVSAGVSASGTSFASAMVVIDTPWESFAVSDLSGYLF